MPAWVTLQLCDLTQVPTFSGPSHRGLPRKELAWRWHRLVRDTAALMVLVAFSRSVWSRNRQRATVSGYLPVSLLVSEVVFAKQACRMPSCSLRCAVAPVLEPHRHKHWVAPSDRCATLCVRWGFADTTFFPTSYLQKHEAVRGVGGCCVAPGEDPRWSVVGTILHVCAYRWARQRPNWGGNYFVLTCGCTGGWRFCLRSAQSLWAWQGSQVQMQPPEG